MHDAGFLISTDDGLYTDEKAGRRKIMYRQFENYMINKDATLTMELKYNIREEELVECSQIKVDLLNCGLKMKQNASIR